MSNIIQATGLVKRYGDKAVLNNVSVSVSPGSITGLIGANGAGKTTLIRAILGLMPLDAGNVRLFGETFSHTADRHDAMRIKSRIGVVLDTCPFPTEVTVKTAGIIMQAAFATWNQNSFESYLSSLGLGAKAKVKDLSRGMGMKLQLACALSHAPELLILDEATAGLDPIAREEVLDILRDYVADESRAVLVSSHITTDLERIADTVVCIDDGHIVFDMEKEQITDHMGLAKCRAAQFEEAVQSGCFEPGTMRFIKQPYGIDLLVPDRFVFSRRFPDIICERMSIDEYMQLTLRGDIR